MKIYNLVCNGDFSGGFADWMLAGEVGNANVVTDVERNPFARLGPNVTLSHVVTVTAETDYNIRFRLRASLAGSGITVKVSGISQGADDIILAQESIGQTSEWAGQGLEANSRQFTQLRLSFTCDSGADIDDIAIFSA